MGALEIKTSTSRFCIAFCLLMVRYPRIYYHLESARGLMLYVLDVPLVVVLSPIPDMHHNPMNQGHNDLTDQQSPGRSLQTYRCRYY